jgi:hypothetical protein
MNRIGAKVVEPCVLGLVPRLISFLNVTHFLSFLISFFKIIALFDIQTASGTWFFNIFGELI